MEATEDIKSRLDIADLIGEYLPLKPAGAGSFKTNCPFHQERTPSFFVSRTRQTWHCFGCDEGGDHFTFIEKMEGMDFREALEFLAGKTGVELPKFNKEQSTDKKRMHEVNELAMRYFRSALQNLPQAEMARAYLVKRGVDDLTADLFKIGFAPEGWTNLTDALAKKNVTADELLRAGLAAKSDRGQGVYDRFRGRLMFPITDVHGNIVGFTGRILTDSKEEAKYVNTPETSLYKKSAVLYGLDKAKGEIRKLDLAVIVEGNMDVVGSHQFGVTNVIACSGTALTGEQLGLIKRFTTNLAIAFDQDAAGRAATLRGLDLARSQDFSIKVITLPPDAGKDPDEAVRKDPEIWRRAIKDSVGIMEWIYRLAYRDRHPEKPEDKKIIAHEVLAEVRRLPDPIERDHLIKKLSFDLGVSEGALREALAKTKAPTTSPISKKETEAAKPNQGNDRMYEAGVEERLFALVLWRPFLLRDAVAENGLLAEHFANADYAHLYEIFKNSYPQNDLEPPKTEGGIIHPPETLNPDEMKTYNGLAFLAEREFQEETLETLKRELKTGVETLRDLKKARERRLLEQDMRDAERIGDVGRIKELMLKFEELNHS